MKPGLVLLRHIIELIVFTGLAVWFILMGWWPALIVEAAFLLLIVYVLAEVMILLVLKRQTPILTGGESVDELRENVREAVAWLETGELWEQTSEDGLLLKGRFMKNEGSHTYAVCCHGYKNIRLQDISNQAKKFYDWGHNVFCGYARGHGFSEGNYIGMASNERRDIVGWINRIVEMDPEARIFLYGVSMGGATVMTTCGEELPDNVRCAIEDCGYSSIWEEFCDKIVGNYGIPVFPVLYVSQFIARLRFGFAFKLYSSVEQLKRANLPILFIHGDQDTFVPYSMLDPVFDACASEKKKKVTIEGARHAEAFIVNPELYWQEVGDWLDTYL